MTVTNTTLSSTATSTSRTTTSLTRGSLAATGSVSITNVDFALLSADEALLESFTLASKEAVASAAGEGVEPFNVEIRDLREGSVLFSYDVYLLAQTDVSDVLTLLTEGAPDKLTAAISSLRGIESVQSGNISLTVTAAEVVKPGANLGREAAPAEDLPDAQVQLGVVAAGGLVVVVGLGLLGYQRSRSWRTSQADEKVDAANAGEVRESQSTCDGEEVDPRFQARMERGFQSVHAMEGRRGFASVAFSPAGEDMSERRAFQSSATRTTARAAGSCFSADGQLQGAADTFDLVEQRKARGWQSNRISAHSEYSLGLAPPDSGELDAAVVERQKRGWQSVVSRPLSAQQARQQRAWASEVAPEEDSAEEEEASETCRSTARRPRRSSGALSAMESGVDGSPRAQVEDEALAAGMRRRKRQNSESSNFVLARKNSMVPENGVLPEIQVSEDAGSWKKQSVESRNFFLARKNSMVPESGELPDIVVADDEGWKVAEEHSLRQRRGWASEVTEPGAPELPRRPSASRGWVSIVGDSNQDLIAAQGSAAAARAAAAKNGSCSSVPSAGFQAAVTPDASLQGPIVVTEPSSLARSGKPSPVPNRE